MDGDQIRVIHVDDDPSLLDLTAELLEGEDDRFVLETATSADDGLDQIRDRPPDCLVSDYDISGKNGIEFLRTVREEYPELPFILFTGKGSETVASDAISAGVTDYLTFDTRRSSDDQFFVCRLYRLLCENKNFYISYIAVRC